MFQKAEVPESRGGKQACNKSNEDDWTQCTTHKVEHKRQI